MLFRSIFLKNTLPCLDSQKKKEEGKFRLFRPYSRLFPACLGRISRRPIRPDMADTAQFWSNQPSSVRIETDLAQIEPHRNESTQVGTNPRKKIKNVDADRRTGNRIGRRVPRRAASDAGASPLVPRPCFLDDYKVLFKFLLRKLYYTCPTYIQIMHIFNFLN